MKDEWKCALTGPGAQFVLEIIRIIITGGGRLVGDHLIAMLCADNLDIWD